MIALLPQYAITFFDFSQIIHNFLCSHKKFKNFSAIFITVFGHIHTSKYSRKLPGFPQEILKI